MINNVENDLASPGQSELWTVQRIILWSAGFLKEKSKDATSSPRLEAEILLAAVLKLDRLKLYLQLDRPLTSDERAAFKIFLRRRAEGEPVAYIIGYRDFYRHRFKVNSHVLIPRPETELLVEEALLSMTGAVSPKVLDVGAGTGCIGISVAAERPDALVTAWEYSNEALQVATENARDLEVKNIILMKQDALSQNLDVQDHFDIIVSNPPYVAQSESILMSFSTLNFEPKVALFADDAEGLQFYRHFAKNFQKLLSPGGTMILEIGFRQGQQVVELLQMSGWQNIKIKKDLAGHDRVVSAQSSPQSK